MNKWNDPSQIKPAQGKKVLCMHKGDIYVAQRFGDYWFSMPFSDSKYSRYFSPNLWQEIDFPHGLTGKIKVIVDDVLMDIDELEIKYPEIHAEMINKMLPHFKDGMKDKFELPE